MNKFQIECTPSQSLWIFESVEVEDGVGAIARGTIKDNDSFLPAATD
jgi:hypothetical protein